MLLYRYTDSVIESLQKLQFILTFYRCRNRFNAGIARSNKLNLYAITTFSSVYHLKIRIRRLGRIKSYGTLNQLLYPAIVSAG
jgi:hypothetical protein